ncbi:MAG TPA: hypothetical protein PLP23_17105 [Panacibacter sp.]|nr:hypothetical protein [Panacibacter sp.]
MRTPILIALILFSINGAAQVYQSSCVATHTMEDIYRNDAYLLAIARVNAIQSPYKDSVEIPAIFRDSLARALYAVYNLPAIPVKEPILNLFGFSDFNPINLVEADSLHIASTGVPGSTFIKHFTLVVFNSATFANAWASGNYNNTPDNTINGLVTNYGLIIKQNIWFDTATKRYDIKTPGALNIQALTNKFKNIVGIKFADPGPYAGDGNFIRADYLTDGILLTYRNGCGDCPAGCTYSATWQFKVYNNCSVDVLNPNTTAACLRGNVTPISFGNLAALRQNNTISLHFKVFTEKGISNYNVERSLNGNMFSQVGSLIPQNSSSAEHNYTWTDRQPVNATCYYRIKALNESGEINYSKVVIVAENKSQKTVSVYPNPVENKVLNIQFTNAELLKYKCFLFKTSGQKMFTKELNVSPGYTLQHLQLPNTISGTMMLVIEKPDGSKILQQLILVK